ncbi:unnamed protein product [Nesidiocoris tenuis]|uniref:Uncharacterized protein n=1 Tax=Nesidiocoris tenuis TaxID=355587 RepID=A0A6H5H8B4_9HEMI|nr:unnamed protein product [Nesidiocoris tenuis]
MLTIDVDILKNYRCQWLSYGERLLEGRAGGPSEKPNPPAVRALRRLAVPFSTSFQTSS